MNTVMALVNSQSDERTKANWRTFENATAMIDSLTKLGTFEFVGGPGETPLSSSLFHLPFLAASRTASPLTFWQVTKCAPTPLSPRTGGRWGSPRKKFARFCQSQ